MQWYYADNNEKAGPVSTDALQALARSGRISPQTLVWRDGLADWICYTEAGLSSVPPSPPLGLSQDAPCAECGLAFPKEEMVTFGSIHICAKCKTLYVQKLREGVTPGSANTFWRSGKRLVMTINAKLPHRCVHCNTPTDDAQIDRKLYWHHPAAYLGLLINVLVYAIIAICVRKRATTSVSLCARHRTARRNVIIASWLMILGGFAAVGVAVSDNLGWAGALSALLFLGGIIFGMARGRLVYATKIDKEHVWLGGCKPAFLMDFPEWTGPK